MSQRPLGCSAGWWVSPEENVTRAILEGSSEALRGGDEQSVIEIVDDEGPPPLPAQPSEVVSEHPGSSAGAVQTHEPVNAEPMTSDTSVTVGRKPKTRVPSGVGQPPAKRSRRQTSLDEHAAPVLPVPITAAAEQTEAEAAPTTAAALASTVVPLPARTTPQEPAVILVDSPPTGQDAPALARESSEAWLSRPSDGRGPTEAVTADPVVSSPPAAETAAAQTRPAARAGKVSVARTCALLMHGCY